MKKGEKMPPQKIKGLLAKPKIEKDAAKARKRIKEEDFEAINVETLSQLLKLPNIEVEQYFIETEGRKQYIHLDCKHKQDVAICPRCEQIATGGYDHKKRSVRHLDIFGMRTILHFEKRRFDCQVCGKPFSEILDWLDPNRRQSRKYEEYIYEQVKKNQGNKWACQKD